MILSGIWPFGGLIVAYVTNLRLVFTVKNYLAVEMDKLTGSLVNSVFNFHHWPTQLTHLIYTDFTVSY